ncbi:MAG TPA: hypothetical protein VJK30_04155 [Coxiellaceae bacterium]|nr:MAG: hypothetical protein A3E81_06605 [Gammaproteobacteria bacterium RIFCSPHIGHO2_12_FULL_36_30]HLB56502.1 hypothetical protein [Coxiellaceae bacterium]
MSEIKGGIIAHIARRIFHASMIIVPFFYYYFFISHFSEKYLHLAILAFIFLVFLFEKLRIRMKLVLFAQKLHEASRISAFAWTMLSLGIILFFAPVYFAMPIIFTCAIVDPLLGEMRLRNFNKKNVITAGIFVAFIIWIIFSAIYHFPFWFGIILAPVSIAAEWPNLKWIDDNAMMLILPLLAVMILKTLALY